MTLDFSFLSETDKAKYKVLKHDVFDLTQSGSIFFQSAQKLENFLDDTEQKYPLSMEREKFLYSSYIHLAQKYRCWGDVVSDINDNNLDIKTFNKAYKYARNLLVFHNKNLESAQTDEQKKRIFNKMIVICPKEKHEDYLKCAEIFMRLGDSMKPFEKIKLQDFGEVGAKYDRDDIYILSARYSSIGYMCNGKEEENPAYIQMKKALDKVEKQNKIDDFIKKSVNVRFIELADIWKESKLRQ